MKARCTEVMSYPDGHTFFRFEAEGEPHFHLTHEDGTFKLGDEIEVPGAVQKPSPEVMDVRGKAGDGQAVGGGHAEGGEATPEGEPHILSNQSIFQDAGDEPPAQPQVREPEVTDGILLQQGSSDQQEDGREPPSGTSDPGSSSPEGQPSSQEGQPESPEGVGSEEAPPGSDVASAPALAEPSNVVDDLTVDAARTDAQAEEPPVRE